MRKPYMWFPASYIGIFPAVIMATGWLFAAVAHSGAQVLEHHYSETPNRELTDQICRAIRADFKTPSFQSLGPFQDCRIEQITSATRDGVKTVLADIGAMGAYSDAIVIYMRGIDEDGSSEECEVHAYQWVPKLGMYVQRASRKSDEVQCGQ